MKVWIFVFAALLTFGMIVNSIMSASNSVTHQEYGTIVYPFRLYGTVQYPNGTGVNGALAHLLDSLGVSKNTTITGGNYEFTGLSRSLTYTLQITVSGYTAINDAITPPTSGDLMHNVVLTAIVTNFTLSGTVTYPNGTSVTGVTAYLVPSSGSTLSTTITNGAYSFPSLSRSLTFTLQITVTGYYAIVDAITPPASGDLQHNVTLTAVATASVVPVPPDGYCYHGAFCGYSGASPTTAQMINDITRFTSATNVNKSLCIAEHAGTINVGEDWFVLNPADRSYMGTIYDQGLCKALIISLDPCVRGSSNATQDELDIAAGKYDSWLSSLASRCKNFKNGSGQLYPLMIKIGIEVNAYNWDPYGESPTAFIAAFRYIVNYFRNHGVTNAVYVWNVNWNTYGYSPSYPISAYYPGDDVVDWLTVDTYRWGASDNFYNQITEFYTFAAPRGKPLGVAEWGLRMSVTTDAQGVTYIDNFFNTLEGKNGQTAHLAFKYIRYHWSQDSGGNRFTIQADNPAGADYYPLSVAEYRKRIADPRYLSDLATSALPSLAARFSQVNGVALLVDKAAQGTAGVSVTATVDETLTAYVTIARARKVTS
jgi:hypothetical protein